MRFYRFGRDALQEFLQLEGILMDKKVKLMPDTEVKRIIWRIFEDHDSSWEARVITLMSAAIITLSVIVFCLETLPDFESAGENFQRNLQPALNACIVHLNGTEPPLRENYTMSATQFMDDVQLRMNDCKEDVSFSAVNRYLTARCLILLTDERFELLPGLLRNTTLVPTLPPVTTKVPVYKRQHDISHHIRHSAMVAAGLAASMTDAAAAVTTTVTAAAAAKVRYTYAHDIDRVWSVCKVLDNKTGRSPYFWYMLESNMRLPAGVIFLIETSCIVWFLIELSLRFFCSPKRRRFFLVGF